MTGLNDRTPTAPQVATATKPQPDVETALRRIRLSYFRVLAPVAVMVFLYNWYADVQLNNLSPVDPYTYPLMVGTYLLASGIIYLKPTYFRLAEISSFAMFAAYLIVSLAVMLAAERPLTAVLGVATITPWFPLLLVVAFLTFQTRQAIGVGAAIYALMLLIVGRQLWHAPAILTVPGGSQLMTNVFFSGIIYILLLSAVTLLKERFIAAEVRANTLAEAANYDYLTSVPNRRGLQQALTTAIAARADGRPVLFALIDVDHFKQINDCYGHSAGDVVLIGAAQTLSKSVRGGDIVGRWGGEEFLVIAHVTDRADALALGERLRLAVAAQHYAAVGAVTVSIGLALAQPDETLDTLIQRADRALYAAKAAGRNRVELAAD